MSSFSCLRQRDWDQWRPLELLGSWKEIFLRKQFLVLVFPGSLPTWPYLRPHVPWNYDYILFKFFSQLLFCPGAERPLFAWLRAYSHALWPTECDPYVSLFKGLNTTVWGKNVRDLTHCLFTDRNRYPPKSCIGKSMIVSRLTPLKSPVSPFIPPPGVKALITLLSKPWNGVTGWEGPAVGTKTMLLCSTGDGSYRSALLRIDLHRCDAALYFRNIIRYPFS